MTFSIAARDKSGAWGVAITTARPAVGSRCIFVNQFGAVATQATVNTGLGYDVSQGMSAGCCPEDAINAAIAADEGAAVRQLIAVDSRGRVGSWTGANVSGWAGHVQGTSVVAAGNLLFGPDTVDSLITTFTDTPGTLSARLLAALTAGQSAGGDKRGRQSAALAVGTGEPWPSLDLRVDDHPEPLSELERLLAIWEATWGVYDSSGTFPPADPPGRYPNDR